MQEVKILNAYTHTAMQDEINNFIKNKKVIDIKYQVCCYINILLYSAIVIYEVEE